MPSSAAIQFTEQLVRPRTLAALARNERLRPMPWTESQICLHAALAAYVAAWDTYIRSLLKDVADQIADTKVQNFASLHTLWVGRLAAALEKFNTPNWENTRNLLQTITGYEPINDWVWPQRHMNGLDVRTRLNEVLKVRHSFAHGHSMPRYIWNTSASGRVRLTFGTVNDVEAFFSNLMRRTDKGMQNHIESAFSVKTLW